MKDKKPKNYSIFIAIVILIIGIIIIDYWRSDVEYNRCWQLSKDLKNTEENMKLFEKTKCINIIRNNLIK